MRITNPADSTGLYRVCFVCTGNICRSPVAEAVFAHQVREAGLDHAVGVLSAGTSGWHRGEPMDPRSQASLARGGHEPFDHVVRSFDTGWFDDLELVVALDRTHTRALNKLATTDVDRAKIRLLLSFSPEQAGLVDVPDPYYADEKAFDQVLTTIEQASRSLIRFVKSELDPC